MLAASVLSLSLLSAPDSAVDFSSSSLAADITRNFTFVKALPEIWSVAHKQVG